MEIGDLVNSGYEGCVSCVELQHKLKEANEKCASLELEIEKKNGVIEWLERKLGFKGVAKCLDFTTQGNLHKNVIISPSTPSVIPPVNNCNSDDDEDDDDHSLENLQLATLEKDSVVDEEETNSSMAKRRKVSEGPSSYTVSSEIGTEYSDVGGGREMAKKKWKDVRDMLADFDKFPEICMKAVCALYRQQTPEEKSSKSTIQCNGRGFNMLHARRGSELAEFLTDGVSESDVKKSVAELQEFDSNGVEKCREMARYYPYQLFAIYSNKEDPFFHML